MSNSKAEQNWFVGTLEIDGYTIPIVGRGATKKEAEREAIRRMAQVWANCLELEVKLGPNPLSWWPSTTSD
jgi:hypothetical protein